MADFALVTADTVHVVGIPVIQHTTAAVEAIEAGAPVRLDASTGKFTNANGTNATEAAFFGMATRSVAAGEALTAVRGCWVDGFTITQNFGTPVYLSDTDGTFADAAGTVSTVVGRIGVGPGTTLGTTYDKLIFLNP